MGIAKNTSYHPSNVLPCDYIGATDPSLDADNGVQAGKTWAETDTDPPVEFTEVVGYWIRNLGNDAWVPFNVAGAAPTGAAGGDLTGTYPNPTIAAGAVSTTELGGDITSAGKALLDDANAAAQLVTLGAAPLASPALTGTPTAPTATANTNTTQIATTAYVQGEIADIIGTATGVLDTLGEISDAINDDANLYTTLATALALKAPLASPALTGNPTAPTQSPGDNSTKVATTAYVDAAAAAAGAPTTADYLVKTANGGLSAERVVTDTTTVTWDWATGGQAKAQIPSDVPLGGNPTTTTQASGNSTTRIATTAFVADAVAKQPEVLVVAIGDETTAITTGVAKVTFRMPFAMTLSAVRGSLTTASSSGTPTFDINEGGASILSTKLTIDSGEKTSTTAATPAVISDTGLADDAEITIDVDVAGTGATGGKVYLIGVRA